METVQNTIPEELERYGLFKKSKTHVAMLNVLNSDSVFGISCMSDKHVQSQETLHDKRLITVREEPSLHVEHQRDVTKVKRNGKCFSTWNRRISLLRLPREVCFDQE